MSKSLSTRRTSRKAAASHPQPGPLGPDREGALFACLKALVAVLLAARLLVAPEASVLGSTLWLVQLWFVAAAVWAWDAWRRGDDRLRFDLCDAAVGIVVAGHVLSALWTFHIGGDRRSALNLMWEWVALGTSFFLLRQVLRRAADAGRLLLATLSLAVALAGLGIYQHYIGFPEIRRQYEEIMAEAATLADPDAARAGANPLARHERQSELQQQLADLGVPLDEPGRRLFEDRLHSTEPFGLFALANTFATVLLAWLVVGLAVAARLWKRADRRALAGGITLLLIPIAYCLLLTKSRTAWVGLAAAGLTGAWLSFRGRFDSTGHGPSSGEGPEQRDAGPRSTWIRLAAIAVLLVAALVFVAALSGGLDRQVVSEAPKSFRYRVQYWTGAAGVIREHPVLGVGPGNFRQHYLRHKLPESSEEIAEPHNFVLDVWASGGFLAVAGLALLVVVGGQKMRGFLGKRDQPTPDGSTSEADSAPSLFRDPLVWGTGLSGLVVLAGEVMLGGAPDLRLLGLLAGWIVLVAAASLVLGRRGFQVGVPVAGVAAACVAVLVHLLGSGGIEMPAVPQVLLLLLALGTVSTGTRPAWRRFPAAIVLGLTAAAVLGVLCLLTATRPVLKRETLAAEGDAAQSLDRNLRRAVQRYQEAAESDPLSPAPLFRLAGLAAGTGQIGRATEYARLAVESDPHNPTAYRLLGQTHLLQYRQSGDPDDAREAAAALSEAVRRYPTSAATRAELALFLAEAGNAADARRQAAQALDLDQINRREGHRDKYLPDTLRTELGRVAGPMPDSGPPSRLQ